MKTVYVSLLLGGLLPASALEKSELLGKWKVESESSFVEGLMLRQREVYEFHKEGKMLTNGVVIAFTEGERQRVLTFGGNDEEVWEFDGKVLQFVPKKVNLTFFSSALEDLGRADFMEALPEAMKEPTVYRLVSDSPKKLIFKDKDDGSKVTMTRIVETAAQTGLDKKSEEKKNGRTEKEKQVRSISTAVLDFDGFKFSKGLPGVSGRDSVDGKLRPTEEILDRLLCQYLAMLWVVSTEKQFSEEKLKELIKTCELKGKFLESEKTILKTPRVEAQGNFINEIGWTFENMSALGWVLGFDLDLDIDSAQADAETIKELTKHLGAVWKDKKAFVKTLKVRGLDEVVQVEDFFYCCHNAFRSAQTGVKGAIPEYYHPKKHGGIIHEKRHALTWVLSPKVKWEDTDLST